MKANGYGKISQLLVVGRCQPSRAASRTITRPSRGVVGLTYDMAAELGAAQHLRQRHHARALQTPFFDTILESMTPEKRWTPSSR